MTEPRNLVDVDYVLTSAQDVRPMRTVLREREKKARETPKAQREAAFRKRAGIVGALQLCTCAWPISKAETSTEHSEWCQCHHVLLACDRAKR